MLGWSHSKRNALNEMAHAQFVPARSEISDPACGSEHKASKGIEHRRKHSKQGGPSTEGNTASKGGPTQKATKQARGDPTQKVPNHTRQRGPNTEGNKASKVTKHRRQQRTQVISAQRATQQARGPNTEGNTASKVTQHRRQHDKQV